MDLDLNDSQHQTNPKSSDVLKRWLDGNQIYRIEKKENFTFGPSIRSQHFTLDIHRFQDWFTNASTFIGRWDCFQDTEFADEKRLNTVSRLIVVAFVLLIIVGLREWLTALIGIALLLLVLWFTMIPTTLGATKSKKPQRQVILYE